MPDALAIDKDGNLVVADSAQARIHVIVGGGKDVRSIIVKEELISGVQPLASGDYAAKGSTYAFPRRNQPAPALSEMRLFRRIAPDGHISGSFGLLTDFGESMTNVTGNACEFDVSDGDSLHVSFNAQNKIEKYGPDGKLVWRADRPLDYTTEVKKKGRIETSGGRVMGMSGAVMNSCSAGIAVDGRGRAWVVTYARQLREDERVQTSMMSTGARGGGISNVTVKTTGNTDLRTTDAYRLDIFDPEGVLLASLPLTHFADVIRISGDQLFLIDRERGVTVYQYRIIEK
jgi:hypothetical protein